MFDPLSHYVNFGLTLPLFSYYVRTYFTDVCIIQWYPLEFW